MVAMTLAGGKGKERKDGRTSGSSREAERTALEKPDDRHKSAHEPASQRLNANFKPVAPTCGAEHGQKSRCSIMKPFAAFM